MNNIKDIATTVAGYLGAFSFIVGAVLTYLSQSGVSVPQIVTVIVGACGALSIAIIGYFGGKNADGSKKSPEQIAKKDGTNGQV